MKHNPNWAFSKRKGVKSTLKKWSKSLLKIHFKKVEQIAFKNPL